MQYNTDLVKSLRRRYKRNVRLAWLTPLQRAVLNQLGETPIKPSSITPRRKVVLKNLILKKLVLHQLCPEDVYVLSDEGKAILEEKRASLRLTELGKSAARAN